MSNRAELLALAEEEQRIDALRLKAFRTNDPDDRQVYFDAASKWFQDRHYRRLAASAPVAKLPCDVRLPPNTTVKKGTSLDLLLELLASRDPEDLLFMPDYCWAPQEYATPPSDASGAVREALDHLGNALYYAAAIHPDDRNVAVEEAIAFYNEARPHARVDASEHALLRTYHPALSALPSQVDARVETGPVTEAEYADTEQRGLLARFVEAFQSGAQGCSMDCDTAKALADAIAFLSASPREMGQSSDGGVEGHAGVQSQNHVPTRMASTHPQFDDEAGIKPGPSDDVQKEAHATKQSRSGTGHSETETATEGERLHKLYDGNGRPRGNGGFCS